MGFCSSEIREVRTSHAESSVLRSDRLKKLGPPEQNRHRKADRRGPPEWNAYSYVAINDYQRFRSGGPHFVSFRCSKTPGFLYIL